MQISYVENWIKDHQKAIESAYRNTPYYEYYADDIFTILSQQFEHLTELNQALTLYFIEKIGLSLELSQSTEPAPIQQTDYRISLSPKIDTGFKAHHYIQTFEDRHGFHPNPSILDLLFNEGPNSISILQESSLL